MSEKKETCCSNPRLGKIGGEAVIEGIMMKAGRDYALAVRQEDKKIRVSKHKYTTIRDKSAFFRLPIIRGVINMVESLLLSYKVLGMSADVFGEDLEEPSKFEKWLEKTFGKSIMDFIMVIASVLGLALGFGLFFFLPMAVTKFVDGLIGGHLGWFKNLIEGVIRIGIFICYIWLVSLMKDIRRTFEYHGAEHKTIFCYEAGLPLTVENIKKQTRFHPRCGTSFIFVVLILSVIVSSFVTWNSLAMRLLLKLPLLPLTVGISFEFIMYAGKHDNLLTKILSAPGLWMQHLTTREPDAGEIEVAIASVKSALADQYPDFKTEEVPGENYALVVGSPEDVIG
ncbi:MAG: DUF1385 domain-containing protein, partial [Clostridia bacterium]|nr:DUF1385 domain-containing protein [Clostridia bacterium]